MSMDVLRQLPPLSLEDLQPRARQVALVVCREYKSQDELEEYRQILSEFIKRIRKAQRSIRVLKKLKQILATLEMEVEKSLGNEAGALCDVVREAHIPSGSPALLPIYGHEPSLKDYLRIRNLPDPAKPLERFFQLNRKIQSCARSEVIFLQDWVQTRRRPKHKRLATFAISGALQYALHILFSRHGRKPLKKKEIETRIATILNRLNNGGPTIDPDRNDCEAIRKAIKRLKDSDKERCTRRLLYLLNSPR